MKCNKTYSCSFGNLKGFNVRGPRFFELEYFREAEPAGAGAGAVAA